MGPLHGIKVVDLTSMVSGPVAAMMLGDQGADVIKVEPIHGEQLRHLGEPHNGVAATFYSCNRNKRSIAVDLKSEAGKEILWKLIDQADVLLQNFRPGAMERMGFGETVARKRNPGLIYVSISGFGEKGPYAHQRVYDPIIQGLSGATDIQYDRATGRPGMFRIILADKVSALTAAQAVSSALFYRERQGEDYGQGQHIKLSMLDATVAFLWPEGMSGLVFADKQVDVRSTFSSIDLIYDTQDGHITISVVSDKEWVALCTALGRDELITDERFSTSLARRKNVAQRREIIATEVSNYTSSEILVQLSRHDVPTAPLLSREELLSHPQLLESETISREIDEGLGEVRQANPAARFQSTPSEIYRPAPRLGQHSMEILQSLSYDDAQCTELLSRKIILQD